jgi:hypothetical protein
MNIGKWIVISFALFAIFIGSLVTVCMQQEISLVSKNYYQEELDYEVQIKRLQNTKELKEKPSITVMTDSLKIYFTQFANLDKGEIKLFCPSNERNDKSFKVNASQSPEQGFPINTLPHGMYKAQFLWSIGEKEFFVEEIINI